MIVLDLHGFVNPMLIEPCTPPHNPNFEYDLYIKWALAQAEAMEAELFAQPDSWPRFPTVTIRWNGMTGPQPTRRCTPCSTGLPVTAWKRPTVTSVA